MHFSVQEQEKIRENMFTEGLQLLKEYGVQRMTVDKLTKRCQIAKGSFYHFYDSKESYLRALMAYAGQKVEEMWQAALAGRKQMTTHEFFQFFHEYLYSDYDLLRFVTIEDSLWIQKHLVDPDYFKAKNQMAELERWLSMMSDARKDVDHGVVANLIKSIYAMRESRATMVESALDDTISIMLRTIENYICEGNHEG